jgi:diaminopimelate epimerase
MVDFVKMHGAGNDFVILDARPSRLDLPPRRIRALSDRRTGIGCDQLIVLQEAGRSAASVAVRIFNPDGSAAGACGNATRCVADLLGRRQGCDRLVIETPAGLLAAELLGDGRVSVDMGPPGLSWRDIPLAAACDTLHLPWPCDAAAASMGNPHATLFVQSLDDIDVPAIGAALEHDPIFPDRANIGFAEIQAPDRIRLRVWERGAGLTLACGSGACAALVNAHRRGLAGRRASLVLDGGTLLIEWREADAHVVMTGPVATAFHGSVDLSTYPP